LLGLDRAPRVLRYDVMKDLATTEIVGDPILVSWTHRAATLTAAQPSAHEQIFILTVPLGPQFVALELGLSGLEHLMLNNSRYVNWDPGLPRHAANAGLFARILLAGQALRFAFI